MRLGDIYGVLCFFLTFSALASPNYRNHDLQRFISEISPGYYLDTLRQLTGEKPLYDGQSSLISDRYSYPNVPLIRHFLAERLSQLGTVRWESTGIRMDGYQLGNRNHTATNLVVDIPGTVRPEEVIIIGAHYDTTGRSKPGANDNGSGVTAVLSLAQALFYSDVPLERTVRFVLFDAEERGFVGSRHYFRELLTREPEIRPILFLNLDMIGDSTDKQRRLSFDAGQYYLLGELLKKANATLHQGFKLTQWREYKSDQLPARAAGIPAVALFDNVVDDELRPLPRYRYYHSPEDVCSNMDCKFAWEVTKLAAATVFLAANSQDQFSARLINAPPYPPRRPRLELDSDLPVHDVSKDTGDRGLSVDCFESLASLRRHLQNPGREAGPDAR